MSKTASVQGLVIVGAGPGGMAPLFAAANNGTLAALLHAGITVIESSSSIGGGALAGYDLESDSSAEALLDVVTRSSEPLFLDLLKHPSTLSLMSFTRGPAPLHIVANFLRAVSQTLCDVISASQRGRVLVNTGALSVRSSGRGGWITACLRDGSAIEEIESLSVVLATGAHQPAARLEAELVAGEPLLPRYAGKLMQTGNLFSRTGIGDTAERLRSVENPKVAIVGGSTSAVGAACTLLHRMPSLRLHAGSVTILHRKPLRLFYESVGEALADGYTDFSASDVCRLTGRVYRLAGLRLGSRELIMGALGVGSRPADARLRLLSLEPSGFEEARSVLRSADLIIVAFGYRPRLLPVYDIDMQEIPLFSPDENQWAVVDQDNRLLDANRQSLNGLFALGLAIGPAASERFGGEAAFRGQVNSLWLWQHTIGEQICEQVLQRAWDRVNVSKSEELRPAMLETCGYTSRQTADRAIAQEIA